MNEINFKINNLKSLKLIELLKIKNKIKQFILISCIQN